MHLRRFVFRLIFMCAGTLVVIAFWSTNNYNGQSIDDDATQEENGLLAMLQLEKKSHRKLISRTLESFTSFQNNSFQDSKGTATFHHESPHHHNAAAVSNRHNAVSDIKHHNTAYDIIMYNRVPKCGSDSTNKLLRILSERNNFTFIRATQYMKFWLSSDEKARLVQKIKSFPKPFVFERHLHFLDFASFHMTRPIYFNIIRDPIERLASWYYFRRFQPGHIRDLPLQDKIRSYDDCVLSNHPECTSPSGANSEEGYFKIIPFFCGQEPFCREPTERALLQAIDNVRNHFVVVGITERYREVLQILERILPQYFEGVTDIYEQTETEIRHQTLFKLPVSDAARRVMRKRLSLEYQFYDFIERRFNKQVKKHLDDGS